MRIPRVYIPMSLVENRYLALPPEVVNYLGTVLRLSAGHKIKLFNENDGEFLSTVVRQERRKLEVEVGEKVSAREELELKIHLFLCFSKGDRMDYAVQKATELGVSEITPVFSENCDVKLKPDRAENKLRHFRKVAIGACEQSGRVGIPIINRTVNFSDVWRKDSGQAVTRIILEPGGDKVFSDFSDLKRVEILVGPEGGLSKDELSEAKLLGASLLSLGSRILRAETAPVVALSLLQYLHGDIG